MKKLLFTLISLLGLNSALHAHGPFYEPFDYPPGPLVGKMLSPGNPWFPIGMPGVEEPYVVPGLLQTQCMEPAATNRVEINTGPGWSAGILFNGPSGISGNLQSNGTYSAGVVLYSLALQVPVVGSLAPSGSVFCALSPVSVPSTNNPPPTFAKVWLRPAAGGYQIGFTKSSDLAPTVLWHTATNFQPTDVVQLVAYYHFIPGADNDSAGLWINPDPTSYCSTPPLPTLEETNFTDAGVLASFVFLQATNLSDTLYADQLHIGPTWTNVVAPGCDFGDAPDTPYRTLKTRNGPSHQIVTNVWMGTPPDAECDGQPTSQANGDDLVTTDDERGGSAPTFFLRGKPTTLSFTASTVGYLNAWVDWNQNGAFDVPAERIGPALGIPLVAGANSVTINAPGGATLGTTYARFRFSTAGNLNPTGHAADGEVEDVKALVADLQPELYHSRTNGGLVLSWDAEGAVLQKAPSLTGPWTTVSNAASPTVLSFFDIFTEPGGVLDPRWFRLVIPQE
jgi:hypothetical protein